MGSKGLSAFGGVPKGQSPSVELPLDTDGAATPSYFVTTSPTAFRYI